VCLQHEYVFLSLKDAAFIEEALGTRLKGSFLHVGRGRGDEDPKMANFGTTHVTAQSGCFKKTDSANILAKMLHGFKSEHSPNIRRGLIIYSIVCLGHIQTQNIQTPRISPYKGTNFSP
jgi:hypothetical protein